jgi:hypothetical protein
MEKMFIIAVKQRIFLNSLLKPEEHMILPMV